MARPKSPNLIPSEKQVVSAIWDGLSQKEIAARLGITPNEIQRRLNSAKTRLHVESTIQLLRRCVQSGVLQA